LSPSQKLALATNFVLNSPPAQTINVLDDVRTLVGGNVLTEDRELALLARVNKEKFAAVEVDSYMVLLTPHGELPTGQFLDPSSGCSLTVDHKALTAIKGADQISSSMKGSAQVREAVDSAMRQYCKEWMPSAVVTTYGFTGAGIKVVCCVAALHAELHNYFSGRWHSEWTLEVPSGGSVGQLTGKVSCNVHYFEDGNVQLEDRIVFFAEVSCLPSEVGKAVADQVRTFECGFIAKMEEIYQNMSETVLQGLRRRLPVTRTKYDWDKLAVGRLAAEMTGLNAGK